MSFDSSIPTFTENAISVKLTICRVLYLNQELINGHVKVQALDTSHSAQMTAQLITECFEKSNTGIRIYECQTRLTALQETMTVLYRNLNSYKSKPSAKTFRTLRGMLNRNYKFAGFTRTYVRQHINEYPDLAEFVSL